MQDVLDACDDPLRKRRVGEIPLDELHAGNVIEIAALAGDQAVGHTHLVSATNELFDEMRSDETRAAGHEVVGHRN